MLESGAVLNSMARTRFNDLLQYNWCENTIYFQFPPLFELFGIANGYSMFEQTVSMTFIVQPAHVSNNKLVGD